MIVHCGGPSPGLNPAARCTARFLLSEGYRVYGAINGIKGLLNDNVNVIVLYFEKTIVY